MKNISKMSRADRPVVSELLIGLAFSFLSAHLFVGFRQEGNYLELFLIKGYPLAAIVSTIIAYLMIIFVKTVTRKLDRLCPWNPERWLRFILQFLLGGVLTLMLEFTCSTTFFSFRGIDISETVYFDSYLLPIIMFIIIVNAYYNSGYPAAIGSEKNELVSPHPSGEAIDQPTVTEQGIDHDLIKYSEAMDVAFISISDKHIYAKNSSGEVVSWYRTIAASIATLPPAYIRVSRKTIVRRDIIAKVTQCPEKNEVVLALKPGINKDIKVSPENMERFMLWWFEV